MGNIIEWVTWPFGVCLDTYLRIIGVCKRLALDLSVSGRLLISLEFTNDNRDPESTKPVNDSVSMLNRSSMSGVLGFTGTCRRVCEFKCGVRSFEKCETLLIPLISLFELA